MKWIKIKSETGKEDYELWDEKEKSLSLSMSLPGFAKINFNQTRRTFMIERKGIFRTRVILRNEYGTKLGQLVFEGNHLNEGFIEMDGQRLRYTINNTDTPEMIIYKPSNEPLLICNLEGLNDPTYNFPKTSIQNVFPALLLALYWRQLAKVSKEPELEFAV